MFFKIEEEEENMVVTDLSTLEEQNSEEKLESNDKEEKDKNIMEENLTNIIELKPESKEKLIEVSTKDNEKKEFVKEITDEVDFDDVDEQQKESEEENKDGLVNKKFSSFFFSNKFGL